MENALSAFSEKFDLERLTIMKTDYWTWSLRPVHSTVGAGILSLNRYCTNFGNITSEESTDIVNIVGIIESTLKEKFSPDKFNYIMLMMVDDHVHFHVIPRYSRAIRYQEHEWEDKTWPGPPDLAAGSEYKGSEELLRLLDFIKE